MSPPTNIGDFLTKLLEPNPHEEALYDASAETLSNSWLQNGDIACKGEESFVYIQDSGPNERCGDLRR